MMRPGRLPVDSSMVHLRESTLPPPSPVKKWPHDWDETAIQTWSGLCLYRRVTHSLVTATI
jgi:hypothetical protein